MKLFPFLTSLVFLLFFFSFSTTTTSSSSIPHDSEEIKQWCRDTPHPRACEYYLTHLPKRQSLSLKDRSSFYKLSLEAALARAIRARKRLRHMRSKFREEPARHAWSDCENLYANTVFQINRTLHPPAGRRCNYYDTQTWLSAALTNINMCKKNVDALNTSLGITSPLQQYNVSDLISNCLAINKPLAANVTAAGTRFKKGFPSWTSAGTRRLLQLSTTALGANLVVAQDGSGNFRTIKEAVAAAAGMTRSGRLVIYVKAGLYRENVQIVSSMKDVTLVGAGKGKTIITGNNGVASGFTLITTATLAVFGDGFIARDLTIQNTYGPGSQALALLLASDQSVVYRCSIEGYQDTLCVFSQRQFYRECDISGTIDFIFGNAAAVIQNSNIIARLPRHGEANVITAQGRTDPNQNTGIVIQFCTISPSPELFVQRTSVKTFLGRPWMQYSRVLYLQNNIGSIVDPAGWLAWNGNFALSTLYYAEFKNTGPGSKMSRRVRWPGYHVIVKPSLVSNFTVANFIAGGMWIPSTGMPFTAGL